MLCTGQDGVDTPSRVNVGCHAISDMGYKKSHDRIREKLAAVGGGYGRKPKPLARVYDEEKKADGWKWTSGGW